MTKQNIEYEVGQSDNRPWGSWKVIAVGDNFIIKEIVVKPDQTLSLQSHEHRSEHWITLAGIATITLNDDIFDAAANETVFIPKQAKHRVSNKQTEDLRFIEIQTGDVLDENDIKRFEDLYGRVS